MTKQKFPREMESSRNGLRAMAAELTRAELELSGSRRADAQPLPLARTGPRALGARPCARAREPRILLTKDSGSLLHPASPSGWGFLSGSDGNTWVTWPVAGPTAVDIHFLVPCLKADWRPKGCGGAGGRPLSLQHPPSQTPTFHLAQPPAYSLFLVNSS